MIVLESAFKLRTSLRRLLRHAVSERIYVQVRVKVLMSDWQCVIALLILCNIVLDSRLPLFISSVMVLACFSELLI